MVRKMDAQGAKERIDWEAVQKATEVPRTYLIETSDGRSFFKMYKPSEAKEIFTRKGWRGKIVAALERTH